MGVIAASALTWVEQVATEMGYEDPESAVDIDEFRKMHQKRMPRGRTLTGVGVEGEVAQDAEDEDEAAQERDEAIVLTTPSGEPFWMPELRKLLPGAQAKRFDDHTFVGTTQGGARVEVEVVEAHSERERRRALGAARALQLVEGGDVVHFLHGASTSHRRGLELPVPGALGAEKPNALFFVTEAGDSDLIDTLLWHQNKGIRVETRFRILIEVLRGLVKLEAAGYMHRALDGRRIKVLGNCTESCDVKLGGFGHATPCAEHLPRPERWGSQPAYVAPEVWIGKKSLRKADVWSAGILAYELFVGGQPSGLGGCGGDGQPNLKEHPFRHFAPRFDAKHDPRLRVFEETDREMGSLIRSMLRRTTTWRPTLQHALKAVTRIAKSRNVTVPEPSWSL